DFDSLQKLCYSFLPKLSQFNPSKHKLCSTIFIANQKSRSSVHVREANVSGSNIVFTK
nr:hypothetical protein [Tanacetum cinerariifolium]